MKNIICKDTLKQFSNEYLKRNKNDNKEIVYLGAMILCLLVLGIVPISLLDVSNVFAQQYKASIPGLWAIMFSFSIMLPNKFLVKFLPKTAYLNLIVKNNYDGEITDILDINDKITKKVILENKERIKFDMHTNGCLTGKTLSYLLKEINREQLKNKKEDEYSKNNFKFVESDKKNNAKIDKIDEYLN